MALEAVLDFEIHPEGRYYFSSGRTTNRATGSNAHFHTGIGTVHAAWLAQEDIVGGGVTLNSKTGTADANPGYIRIRREGAGANSCQWMAMGIGRVRVEPDPG